MNLLPSKNPRYTRTKVDLPKQGDVYIYAGKHIVEALKIIDNHSIYEGVKLQQLMEVVYTQGKKDGARSVFREIDILKGKIPHRNPGQPKKK
jgi:hypothetical protein